MPEKCMPFDHGQGFRDHVQVFGLRVMNKVTERLQIFTQRRVMRRKLLLVVCLNVGWSIREHGYSSYREKC